MHEADRSQARRADASPLWELAGLMALAAGTYAAHAWLADSPYWLEHGHRPWIVALRMAALAFDWSQGVKFAAIAGSSLWVLRTEAPRRARELKAPRRPKASPAFHGLALETAR